MDHQEDEGPIRAVGWGGHVDLDCNPGFSDAAISIRYVDFDMLAEAAERIARSDEY
ncbi:MAG: hypothetical protein WD602_06605 [Actinomycetota bacterium]